MHGPWSPPILFIIIILSQPTHTQLKLQSYIVLVHTHTHLAIRNSKSTYGTWVGARRGMSCCWWLTGGASKLNNQLLPEPPGRLCMWRL